GKPPYVLSHDAWVGGEIAPPPPPPPPTDRPPLNLILYGPAGTGKTYATKRLAVEICDGAAPADRAEVLARYNQLHLQNRIEFVTFHQSFSYEDFVEGLRPVLHDGAEQGAVEYECRPGVFKRVCAAAEAALEPGSTVSTGFEIGNRRLFKMSLGDTNRP